MTFLEVYGIGALIILGLMAVLWLVSLALKDSSIVDVFWGPGFVLACWVYFALTPDGFPARKWLISVLITIWGVRLGLYILWRNWGKGEDFRYQKWREEAGKTWWWYSFFKVFLLQGVLLWIISAPLLAAQHLKPTGLCKSHGQVVTAAKGEGFNLSSDFKGLSRPFSCGTRIL